MKCELWLRIRTVINQLLQKFELFDERYVNGFILHF